MNTNRRSRAKNTNRSVPRKSTFDKSDAARHTFDIANAGTFELPATLAGKRSWIEWTPRADAPAPDRRFFVGNRDVEGAAALLGAGGTKLPRGGRSLDTQDRHYLALHPGRLIVWTQGVPRAGTGTVTVEPLPAEIVSPAMLGNAQVTLAGHASGLIMGAASGASTPQRGTQQRRG